MKEFKAAIIAAIITCIILYSCAFALPANAEAEPESYKLMGVVVNVSCPFPGTEEVLVMDANGEVAGFYADPDDFHEGDVLVLTFIDLHEIEEEDELADVEYIGTIR